MILITGTFRISLAGLNAARPAMKQMIAASRAEHGCLGYSYAEDVLELGLIRVTELWTDQAALDHHLASDHLSVWRAEWPLLGITDRSLQAYDVGQSRPT